MKPLILLIILVVILAGLPIVVASDTSTSFIDTNVPDNEMATSQTQISNSSATGTITITLYAGDCE